MTPPVAANVQPAQRQFRKGFLLLMLMVVGPSAGLSTFGVLAIVNERAAVEKRLEATWAGRLDALAGRVMVALETTRRDVVPGGLHVELPSGQTLSEHRFALEGGRIFADDEEVRASLQEGADSLREVHEVTAVSLVSSGTPFIALVERRGGRVLGATLDLAVLSEEVERLGTDLQLPGERVHFELRAPQRELREGLLSKVVGGVQEAREAALGSPPGLASRPLPEPLQAFTLVALPLSQDPVGRTSTRNRTLYVVLLVLLYATLTIGVIYTARTMYREAKLSRLKTDFVSLVTHELRTPLTSIRMFIEMMAQGRVKDPAEQQQVLDLLAKESARLSSMIDRVLDWSRIESGRKQYHREQVTVPALVDYTLSALRVQRMGEPLDLQVQLEEDLPVLEVDREAIAGALLNLLQNAYKYSGDEKRIQLRARRDGRGVSMDVEDNGVGIPARERKRVFDRFYRIDNLLTRKSEGSGLGLAIAKRIIEAHGGTISLHSEVGKGSCFTLHLPVGRHAFTDEGEA